MNAAEQSRDLTRIAERARYVLLDFDGPVCKVFTDPTARTVTTRLRALIKAHGTDISPDVQSEAGPHDLLHFAAAVSTELCRSVEGALRALEIDAATTATPTPGADELLKACEQTGRLVAVVSNNAAEAVAAYLNRSGLAEWVTHVEGRDARDPSLMKPNPYLIARTLHRLDADAAACVLVGDSVTDIESAHAAGVHSVGYANKPGKRERLTEAGADALVDSMSDLEAAFSAHRTRALPN